MSINTFAILQDGYGKPGTVTGKDWANKPQRSLLVTEGYWGQAVSTRVRKSKRSKWLYQFNYFYRKRR
jgi:hypothetical protein